MLALSDQGSFRNDIGRSHKKLNGDAVKPPAEIERKGAQKKAGTKFVPAG